MCSCNLTVCLKRWWGQQFDGSRYSDIFTWLNFNYHPDLKVPCVNGTADNFIVTKKKKTTWLTKFFSPFSLFLFHTVYHYMTYHVSWSLNTVSRIAELQPKVTFSLAQIPLKIEHDFEINITDNLTLLLISIWDHAKTKVISDCSPGILEIVLRFLVLKTAFSRTNIHLCISCILKQIKSSKIYAF